MMNCTLKAVQGDLWAWTATFTNDDDTPYDLSIYEGIQMQIRKKPNDPVVASGSLATGEFSISGVDNNILVCENVLIPDTIKGVYMFDVEFLGFEIHETLISGTITIMDEITKDWPV